MAEIPIERKPRRSVGPLLLILILIVLLGAGWWWWTNKNNNAAATTTTSSITPLARVASISVPTSHGSFIRRV